MKVKYCRKCESYFESRKWSSSYKPANYHEIGVSHVYSFCKLHNCRCLEVKKCKINNEIRVKDEDSRFLKNNAVAAG